MGFLNQLLKYKNICIQCHNSPDADALAAAYGVYTYLKLHDINVSIIYSGDYEIQKKDLLYMIDICEIPVEYIKELPKTDLLLLVDGQYGRGNVYRFEADNIAMIDHHMPSMKKTENAFIDYSYQSCSTIVWELLKEEGYDVKANEKLSIAFLYGLYTDTSSYVDLYKKHDIAMRDELSKDYPELERLKKSSMSLEDLMIAGEALYHAYFDKEKQYLLISAMHCEQSVLGIIGDMAIKVDVAKVSIAYTDIDSGYQVSIRSAVALGVAGFLIPGVLGLHMAAVMLVIVHPLDFLKAEIRLLRVLPKLMGGKAPVAVPVDILPCPFCVNVFAVLHIEPAVIVAGIVGAMLAGAPVVSCQFQTIFLLPAKMFRGRGRAAMPQILRKSASGNTQYKLTQASTFPGQGVSPLTRWDCRPQPAKALRP